MSVDVRCEILYPSSTKCILLLDPSLSSMLPTYPLPNLHMHPSHQRRPSAPPPSYKSLPTQSIQHPKAFANPPLCRGSNPVLLTPGKHRGTNSSIFPPVHTIVLAPSFVRRALTVTAVLVRHSSLRNGGSARMTSTFASNRGGRPRRKLLKS